MKKSITRLIISLFMLLSTGTVWPAPASAEDFTVHVPITISNITPPSGDTLTVQVTIYNANGETIASGSNRILTPSYNDTLTLKFNYLVNAPQDRQPKFYSAQLFFVAMTHGPTPLTSPPPSVVKIDKTPIPGI